MSSNSVCRNAKKRGPMVEAEALDLQARNGIPVCQHNFI